MKYIFPDAVKGIHIIESGYATLAVINQIATVDKTNAAQVRLAEEYGGQPIVKSASEKKPAKKPAKSETKKS